MNKAQELLAIAGVLGALSDTPYGERQRREAKKRHSRYWGELQKVARNRRRNKIARKSRAVNRA